MQNIGRQLRLSDISKICSSYVSSGARNHMDVLEYWLPGTVINLRDSEKERKNPPAYNYDNCVIYASVYQGHIYATGDATVTQIMGRLYGSARGNVEKERKNAEIIRKHVSRELVKNRDLLSTLIIGIKEKIEGLQEDIRYALCEDLLIYVFELAEKRIDMTPLERDSEAAAMDDEVFDSVLYNAGNQLREFSVDGTSRAILWLMLGGLLRNEAGRIYRVFNSAFIPAFRQGDLPATILDKLEAMYFPEDFEEVYTGDDLEKRFPGIEWICDNCGSYLNVQEGFDDHLPVWQCRSCGSLNFITADAIYMNDEERAQDKPVDWDKMKKAIELRKNELEL